MSSQKLIAGQAGISYGGFLFGQSVRFAFNLLVARLLGHEALGVYALAFGMMQIAETIGVGGYDAAVVRYMNLYPKEHRMASEASGFAIRSAVLASLVPLLFVTFFSAPITRLLHGGELLRYALLSYAMAVPFNVVTVVAGHAIQAHRDLVPKIVATQILSPLAMLVLLLLVLASGSGPGPALLIPYTAASVISCLWIGRQLDLKTGTGFREVLHAPADSRMRSFAFALLGVSLLSMLSYWLDILLLGVLGGPALSGLYQPAARTAGLLRAVLPAFAGIVAPIVAAFQAGDQPDETGRLYRLVTRWMVLCVTPATIFLMLLPEPVLLLFGSGFLAAKNSLGLLAAAAFVQAFGGIAGTVLSMAGHARATFVNALVALIAQVVLSLMLIPAYGVAGAAAATLGSMLLLTVLRFSELAHLLGIRPFSCSLWKSLAAGTATALVLFLCRPWLLGLGPAAALAVGLLFCTAIYLGFILLFGLEQEERDLILSIMGSRHR